MHSLSSQGHALRDQARRGYRHRLVVLAVSIMGALCCPAVLVSSFPAGDSSWQLGTLAVGNLDGSPDLEIVVPYRDSSGHWFLDAFKFNGQRLPGFPYASGDEPLNTSPTLFDLNHDGRDEILFTRGNHVIALRGDGSVLWSNTVDSASYVPDGGYQTITGGFYWYPGGGWLSHLPSTAIFSSEVSSPMVMDLNGNGDYEVLTAWKIQPDPIGGGQDYNPFIQPMYGVGPWGAMGENWSGGVVSFAAANGQQNFVYHLHHLVESGLAVGRGNDSGPLNVYTLNDSDSVVGFDKSQPFGLWGKGMLHKQFGKNQRLMTGSYQVPIDVYTADIDGDGLDEVLVAGTQLGTLWQPNETILDDDGSILWRRWLPHLDVTNQVGWLNCASLIPVNPDHDNHIDVLGWNHGYDITFRYWNGSELVDRPGWPKSFYPLLPTPPVVGDVDGDGMEEIVIGTYDASGATSEGGLRIYALDGTLKQSIAVPGGIKQIPALADVEGVGRIDVVYRSLLGQVFVQNFGSKSTNLVSWATHRGNMRRDGNQGSPLFPPGTPMVNRRTSGFNRVAFGWTNSSAARCYRIYRAELADGPFQQIATVPASATSYTDDSLRPGWEYFYEVGAVYATNTVHSAPFALLSLLNSNLLDNSGFELNDNCRWDKWFTGPLEMTNMTVTTNTAYQGRQSMQVTLQPQGNNGSIAQFNQYGIPDATVYVTPGAYYSFGAWFKSDGITQPSEHWLEWGSAKTGYDTNDRPTLPDPLYYTPHFVPGTDPVDWTYVNRTFQLPDGFPNVGLWHRYSIAAPCSGSIYLDNVFFRTIPAPSATNWTTVVPFGSNWRYLAGTPPSSWADSDFNDASWTMGTAKFGAGSGPTNVITQLPQQLPAYYFRRKFVAPPAGLEELLLSATCTDAAATGYYPLHLYLNGTEVKTFLDTVTMQGNETRYCDLTPFATLIHPGTNTIAVQLGNYWSDYDDVAFDIRLQAVSHQPAAEPSLSLRTAGSSPPLLSARTPAGTIWRIQSSDTLATNTWQDMVAFTNISGGELQTFPDTGQNGRPKPATVPSRSYRLVPF